MHAAECRKQPEEAACPSSRRLPSQSQDPPEEAKLQTVPRPVAAGAGRGSVSRQAELQDRDATLHCCSEDTRPMRAPDCKQEASLGCAWAPAERPAGLASHQALTREGLGAPAFAFI